MAKKEKNRLLSPKGIAVYPRLNKPDTKWNAAGDFSVKLRLGAAEGGELQAKLEAILDEYYAAECEKAKKPGAKTAPKLKRCADLPWKPVLDDEQQETGEIEFKFKRTASGVSKKDGKPWTAKIHLIDAKRRPTTADIWSGSTLKISFEPYCWNKSIGVGISLRPHTVQVIDLVQGGGRSDADMFDDEEGFEDEGEDTAQEDTSSEDAGDSSEAGDETDPTNF